MKKYSKVILVTCAFPYANGPIHLGHLLEHIQADIWVRYQKMDGKRVFFICADDSHGTPIMLKSKKLGISCKAMIKKIYRKHKNSFASFNISHDYYSTTNSFENYNCSLSIYKKLKKNGFIKKKKIFQLYDKKKNFFLPDRFVKGNCPRCRKSNQYGDNCEKCGLIYDAVDLVHPKSLLSNSRPVIRSSKHLFFDLPKFEKFLYFWIRTVGLQKQVFNKIKEWFQYGLKQWNISRDSPYFGFKIPDFFNKYFYVWMDATICYISTSKKLCKKYKLKFKELWKTDSKVELYQFIGKDIIYFHSLFWPALLEASNLRKPTNLFVHGHLKINGKKMSKSKNNFIQEQAYSSQLDSDYLRYYYASKLSEKIQDIDLNFKDFMRKTNSDIVNKIINLAARNASFISKYFKRKLSKNLYDINLYKKFVFSGHKIKKYFKNRKFSKAIKKIIKLADIANQYINQKKPWKNIKKNKKKVQNTCSMGINLFKVLMIYLKPVMPNLAKRVEFFLNSSLHFKKIRSPLINHKIRNFQPLLSRITKKQINSVYSFNKKIRIV